MLQHGWMDIHSFQARHPSVNLLDLTLVVVVVQSFKCTLVLEEMQNLHAVQTITYSICNSIPYRVHSQHEWMNECPKQAARGFCSNLCALKIIMFSQQSIFSHLRLYRIVICCCSIHRATNRLGVCTIHQSWQSQGSMWQNLISNNKHSTMSSNLSMLWSTWGNRLQHITVSRSWAVKRRRKELDRERLCTVIFDSHWSTFLLHCTSTKPSSCCEDHVHILLEAGIPFALLIHV